MKEQMSIFISPTPVSSHVKPEPQTVSLSARKGSPLIDSVGEVLSCAHQVHELYSATQDEVLLASADQNCVTDTSVSFSKEPGPSDT